MLPEGIPTVCVTGRFLFPDGKPLSGQVSFRAPSLITFGAYDVILGGPVVASLDATGAFEVVLPATDAPGMNPSDWSYQVAEQLTGVPINRVHQVLLPSESPEVDLADIAPTDPTTPTYVAVRGDSAYEVAVEDGFEGSVAQWLASLVGPQGVKGDTGNTGATGPGGDDAYEVAVAAGYGGTRAQWLASLVGPTGATGDQGPAGAPGVVQSVNGISEADVVLDAATVRAVPDTAPGAPLGVAQLDASGKVPAEQLPEGTGGGAVATVNNVSPDVNGNVTLAAGNVGAATAGHTHTAAQVGAVATIAVGTASGVAALDSAARLPAAQAPAASPRNVWTPHSLGFAAWSCDPFGVANPVAKYLTLQRLYLTGINITENTTVTRAVMFARGYGGVPADRFMAGIYRENGTRVVASSAVALTAANFFMTTTPFPRAWYIAGQTTLPTTVNPSAASALADHDIPIMALAA